MPFSTSVTGAAISGLTTPSYTLTPDQAPQNNAKQWLCSALGGTQTGVQTHTSSNPFTFTVYKPIAPRQSPPGNGAGIVKNNPSNRVKCVIRKGAAYGNIGNGQYGTVIVTVTIDTPAGSDVTDPVEVKAALSAATGWLNGNAQALSDVVLLNQLA